MAHSTFRRVGDEDLGSETHLGHATVDYCEPKCFMSARLSGPEMSGKEGTEAALQVVNDIRHQQGHGTGRLTFTRAGGRDEPRDMPRPRRSQISLPKP